MLNRRITHTQVKRKSIRQNINIISNCDKTKTVNCYTAKPWTYMSCYELCRDGQRESAPVTATTASENTLPFQLRGQPTTEARSQ
jgi:hypothetical protein